MRKGQYKHPKKYHRIREIWRGIKKRCNNKGNTTYINYGERGITYDPRWEDFNNFLKDMWVKWYLLSKLYGEHNLSIERENVDKNYTKNNCTFIPLLKQNGNRRNNKLFKAKSPNGKIYFDKNQKEFAREHNLHQASISRCLLETQKQTEGWTFKYVNL